jgi:N-methylhydantoinase B/oxoprolinase/acetone carboxylase alpha subunit
VVRAARWATTWVERALDGPAHGTREVLGYSEQVEMQVGDVFVVSTPSGGGFGPADLPVPT